MVDGLADSCVSCLVLAELSGNKCSGMLLTGSVYVYVCMHVCMYVQACGITRLDRGVGGAMGWLIAVFQVLSWQSFLVTGATYMCVPICVYVCSCVSGLVLAELSGNKCSGMYLCMYVQAWDHKRVDGLPDSGFSGVVHAELSAIESK